MKLKTKIIGILFFLALGYGFYSGALNETIDYTGGVINDFSKSETLPELPPECDSCISIANWNIQTFGKTKWAKEGVKEKILSVLPYYDIIFIQEIRDKSGESFEELCEELEWYNCEISSRAGRSSSKEQYGVIYRKNIAIIETIDYNLDGDSNDYWERPPFRVSFRVDNYEFTAYNIHIKPDDVENELLYLENLVENAGNVVVLGDFNADGFYYGEENNEFFLNYEWIIDNNMDTTVADSDNTYDRILMNNEMFEDFKTKGVYKDIEKEVSDHYLVWAQIEDI